MTKPTVVFFGPDGGKRNGKLPHNKVYLRTLLYSTSKRGQMIESMHVNVQRGESRQNFSVWVYGEKDGSLFRGSGLFVGQDGVTFNHHFLLPKDGNDFRFSSGNYVIRVYAKRVCDREPSMLHEVHLKISDGEAVQLAEPDSGIYFDWGPDQQTYNSHIDVREESSPFPFPFEIPKRK